MLRPRVVGEWVGREEEDADPLAAEMLHPPVPRAKTEVCRSGDSSPAGRLVICNKYLCRHIYIWVFFMHNLNEIKFITSENFITLLLALSR